ncbi:MAG: hypothetical protein IJ180_05740, partial [Bacteroidales bacterium]|nr:hypothetical protein [Bacteroidales bacterium]
QQDESVDTIIIYAQGDWSWVRGPNQNIITSTLKSVRSEFSKTWGRGDFNFHPGDLSEEDSLFLINNGWTVNKDLQK